MYLSLKELEAECEAAVTSDITECFLNKTPSPVLLFGASCSDFTNQHYPIHQQAVSSGTGLDGIATELSVISPIRDLLCSCLETLNKPTTTLSRLAGCHFVHHIRKIHLPRDQGQPLQIP